jgi:carboxyl-terminal processing protease
MSSRSKYFIVTASTCITLMLLIGNVIGKPADETLKHIGVFSDVVSHIKAEYVEEPDMKSVTLGALNGMLEAIDPFASYLNADQYKEYLRTKDAKRADVGLILSRRFGLLGVVAVTPNSPAAKAGFSTYDMIESIKGISTRDMPLAYAALLLQGDAGSSVEVSVVHVRRSEPQTVKLTRAFTPLPPVESRMIDGQVGYINIDALSPAHVKEVATAIQKLQKDGAQKFMVDVRNCAIGTPEDGIALANLFESSGRIAYLEGQRVSRQDFNADASKAVTTLPIVVLTNRGTAGAAELLAASILDNKRGQVVGERTYGDAAVRKAITMDDGGAIILSVAKYYSPNPKDRDSATGRLKSIQDTGVTPSSPVADIESQIEYDDNGEPIPESIDQQLQQQKKKVEDDPVVKKALEVLGAKA